MNWEGKIIKPGRIIIGEDVGSWKLEGWHIDANYAGPMEFDYKGDVTRIAGISTVRLFKEATEIIFESKNYGKN